jgi:hypothetical protein
VVAGAAFLVVTEVEAHLEEVEDLPPDRIAIGLRTIGNLIVS